MQPNEEMPPVFDGGLFTTAAEGVRKGKIEGATKGVIISRNVFEQYYHRFLFYSFSIHKCGKISFEKSLRAKFY